MHSTRLNFSSNRISINQDIRNVVFERHLNVNSQLKNKTITENKSHINVPRVRGLDSNSFMSNSKLRIRVNPNKIALKNKLNN